MRILFVGNSYTSRNDLPRLIVELAAAAAPPVEVRTRMIVAGGASLRRHWNAGHVQQALERERFDVVVLQEQSTLPVKNTARYHENVRMFAPAIRAHGGRIALYVVWARQARPETQRILEDAAREIAKEVDASLVPVGTAWAAVLRQWPDIALFEADGSHPTRAGSCLSACVFARQLVGVNVKTADVATRLGLAPDVAAALDAAADVAASR